MKLKRIKTLLFSILLIFFLLFSFTEASSLTKPLYLGITDPEVKTLQLYLNNNGYIVATSGNGSPNNETTYFGQRTKDAVIKLQLANNLTPDGVVGPSVRNLINQNQVTPPSNSPLGTNLLTKTLKQNITDSEVKILQTYLNTHGFIIATSGNGSPNNETTYFGQKTKDAVIKFQLANNLIPDGVVGLKSRNIINQSIPSTGTIGGQCTGTALFNAITGQPCTSTTTGCTATSLFNSITGLPCTTAPRTGGGGGGGGGGSSSSTYTLTTNSSGTGTGTLSGTEAGTKDKNTSVSITASPNDSSTFTNWTATGSSSSCNGSSNTTCTFTMTSNASVTANFTLKTFTLTSSAGSNGTITATETVNYGSNKTFTITPNEGYHILDVLVDDVSIGAVSTYEFTNVTATHTISATFNTNTSSDKDITSFTFNSLSPVVIGVINQSDHTISLTVPFGTDITSLSPTIIHTGASVSPASGVSHTFINGASTNYTVTATDNSTQIYEVTVNVGTLEIGQRYGGGTIFYILKEGDYNYDASKVRGFITSNEDVIDQPVWSNIQNAFAGTDNTMTVGNGVINTYWIIQQEGHTNSIAKYCDDLVLNGYDDWFLPSNAEMQKFVLNRAVIPNSATSGSYWTSSEHNINTLFNVTWNGGDSWPLKSATVERFRPIRSFSVDI